MSWFLVTAVVVCAAAVMLAILAEGTDARKRARGL
jgi:hypothetical protein